MDFTEGELGDENTIIYDELLAVSKKNGSIKIRIGDEKTWIPGYNVVNHDKKKGTIEVSEEYYHRNFI